MCIFVFLEVKKNYKFSYIDKIMQGIKNEWRRFRVLYLYTHLKDY